jgi:hypothetical protein
MNGISVLLNGAVTTLSKDDPRYQPLTEALAAGETDESVIALLTASPKQMLVNEIDEQHLSDLITIVGDSVFYKHYAVDNSLTRRMLDHLRGGVDIKPLIPFLENLMLNPSNKTVEHLYAFLEYGKIPLTTDGHFLAYKAVRDDWYDIYTGTISNAVGDIVEVPRNQVDEDSDRTCSHGLHVCSFDYLPHFSHADGHVVIVKVNPRDVVAIPRDYNNTKMRVCRYEVVGEVEGYYEKRENYLASQLVFSDFDARDPDPNEFWDVFGFIEEPDVDDPVPAAEGPIEEDETWVVALYSSDADLGDDDWLVRHEFGSQDEALDYACEQVDATTPFGKVIGPRGSTLVLGFDPA